MAHVIVDYCVKDAVCIESCPSDAIHPVPSEADFDTVSQLFINPAMCMDCGACAVVCPSNAIYAVGELPKEKADFARLNYVHFLPEE